MASPFKQNPRSPMPPDFERVAPQRFDRRPRASLGVLMFAVVGLLSIFGLFVILLARSIGVPL